MAGGLVPDYAFEDPRPVTFAFRSTEPTGRYRRSVLGDNVQNFEPEAWRDAECDAQAWEKNLRVALKLRRMSRMARLLALELAVVYAVISVVHLGSTTERRRAVNVMMSSKWNLPTPIC